MKKLMIGLACMIMLVCTTVHVCAAEQNDERMIDTVADDAKYPEGKNVQVSGTLANRLYGDTRYETAFEIADVLKEELGISKYDHIVVASGKNFADALSGSYLAGIKNAPVILTNGNNAQDVKNYIYSNVQKGGTVYILGGTLAVSEDVACGLEDYTVKRLEGEDRYETNLQILNETGVSATEILVCTGKNFADSLSGSATGKPILLVNNKSLSAGQKTYLSSLKGKTFYILGGKNAVGENIEKALQKYGTVKRIAGDDRYKTSVKIAKEFFNSSIELILASGSNYPDGLCGGVLAAKRGVPLIITKSSKETEAKNFANEYLIHKGTVLGGSLSELVNDTAVKNILGKQSVLENKPIARIVQKADLSYSVCYEVVMGNQTSADQNYYLMYADEFSEELTGSPIASVKKDKYVRMTLDNYSRTSMKELAMKKFILAVKNKDGSYTAVSQAVSVRNPEFLAKNTKEIFKASSKKGIQGVLNAGDGQEITDARNANSKQSLFNLDLADLIKTKAGTGCVSYKYKGKTYYFSDCAALRASISGLNEGYVQYIYGNSGGTPVAVTLCILLSYSDSTKNLIDPLARTKGKTYYTLNVTEKTARDTLAAAFLYLGEIFGQEDCYVTNWILGNEMNASKAWNYSGSLNFNQYMKRYTTAYHMLYNAVKMQKTGNTVSISLDNGWTAVTDTYSSKQTLDSFAERVYKLNPNMQWSISYHPYSYPLTRVDFWNDNSNTTNSTSTKYISMKNIKVLTDYASSLEKTYGMNTNSIRILLTEQGYSYQSGNPKQQAQAIARAYYTAEFNNRIDAFIIRALVDDEDEMKGGLYLGITNEKTEKRTSFYVYEYMDSDLTKLAKTAAKDVVSEVNYGKFNDAKNILCNTNWKSIISGFDTSKLAGMK